MPETSCSTSVSTKLQRIAELARQGTPKKMVLTTLAHHIDIDLLHEAWRRTRKDGAAGIDGVSAEQYQAALDANLRSLLERFHAGSYRAPAVRRVHIPKGDGEKTRPIGIPTVEDKVLQRAVSMVLEAVYEQDFLACSYGFRPGRSAHQALEALWQGLMDVRGGWVLDIDIQRFFDTLDHRHLRAFLDQRVRDGVLRRAIDKWLKAGVMEAGLIERPTEGTPQGGVISPLLANIYLHEVLDVWFETEVKPRLSGRAQLIRYADDAVLVFSSERDARRVLEVLPKRLGRYGLVLHPEKTRLVEFRRPRRGGPPLPQDGPGSFDMLGFTHYWGRSRSGSWVVKKKTASTRLTRAIKATARWCREHRHMEVAEQHATLVQKLRGHYAYYGVTGNMPALSSFREQVRRAWRRWLHRRSQRARMWWTRFEKLLRRFPLPLPRIVHRFAAKPMT